jgi:hypothetical protein
MSAKTNSWARFLVAAMLGLVGVIHLLPLSGVLGSERLTALYGLAFDEPNLVILMRHRAMLLGLVGLLCLVAAFRPALRSAALVAGFAAVVSFLGLAASVGGANPQLLRVVTADRIALAALVVALVAHLRLRRGA